MTRGSRTALHISRWIIRSKKTTWNTRDMFRMLLAWLLCTVLAFQQPPGLFPANSHGFTSATHLVCVFPLYLAVFHFHLLLSFFIFASLCALSLFPPRLVAFFLFNTSSCYLFPPPFVCMFCMSTTSRCCSFPPLVRVCFRIKVGFARQEGQNTNTAAAR